MPQYRLKNCMVSSWIGWVVTADSPEEAYVKLRTYAGRVLGLPSRYPNSNHSSSAGLYSFLGRILRNGFEVEECVIDRSCSHGPLLRRLDEVCEECRVTE